MRFTAKRNIEIEAMNGYPGSQSVQTVDEVHRIGKADDPENRHRMAMTSGRTKISPKGLVSHSI